MTSFFSPTTLRLKGEEEEKGKSVENSPNYVRYDYGSTKPTVLYVQYYLGSIR